MKLQAGPEDRGTRLDHFLAQRLASISRSQLQNLNRSGGVRIEGRQEKDGYRLRGSETVEVELRSLDPLPLEPQQMPIQIVYEDADIAVVDKPAGLIVHPGAGTRNATLVHGLLHHFKNLSDAGGATRPGIVHRLDKNTSGLLIVAKNNPAHAALGRAFEARQVEKTYLALVHGKFAQSSGTVELEIGRHRSVRTRMAARPKGGRSALTRYRVIESFKDFSLLEVEIKTGRTHQIRVHLSAIGHPVVGDDIYGETRNREFNRKYGNPARYFLHAARLRFRQPVSGEMIEVRSELPPELQKLLRDLHA